MGGQFQEERQIIKLNQYLFLQVLSYKPYFLGYFRRPDLTEEKLDKDGWFHSGDIAMIKPDGTLTVIDRMGFIVKNSIVISY